MKRGIKNLTAIALSAILMTGTSICSFATEPSTTAGTGNILDFKVTTQVVPTALKLAINPNGYDVNVRYAKVADSAEFSASTKYYTENNGVYSIETIADATAFAAAKANLYVADTKNTQIVTFNYGLANKSTTDQKISVKFDVAADENVEFVGTAAEATAEAAADDGGAKLGEYKIFLQLVPAKAAETITTNTYAKASGTYDSSAVYYTRAGETYTKVTTNSEDAFKAGSYYISTTTIGTEILSKELADVTMTNSTAPIVFAAGEGTTSAEVAYKLPKATFALKSTEFLDFDTETDDVEAKFEMTGIGGLAGFTFAGTMNTNTQWSQLETKTITITPTYRFEDSDGKETAVDTGLNQVVATPADVAPSAAATQAILESGKTAQVTVNLGSGTKAATGVASFVNKGLGNDWLAVGAASYSDGVITLTKPADIDYLLGAGSSNNVFVITFNDDDDTEVEVTLTAKE